MSPKVALLGAGVGIPQPGRSQAAILVENDLPLLLDCGLTSCGGGSRQARPEPLGRCRPHAPVPAGARGGDGARGGLALRGADGDGGYDDHSD